MAVTYDFQTPGVSTSAADTQEDIRNIAEAAATGFNPTHTLSNIPTNAWRFSTVATNALELEVYNGSSWEELEFSKIKFYKDGRVIDNSGIVRLDEYISMGAIPGYNSSESAVWSISSDINSVGTTTFDPILGFSNAGTERARIYTDTSDSHKLKFDVGGSVTHYLGVSASDVAKWSDPAGNQLLYLQADGSANGQLTLYRNAGADTAFTVKTSGNVGIGTSSPAYELDVNGAISSRTGILRAEPAAGASVVVGSRSSQTDFQIYNTSDILRIYNGASDALSVDTSGEVTVNTGNLVIGTSGKGIDFSATSDVAGATSELLDDYEEGTFTPTLYYNDGADKNFTLDNTTPYTTRTGSYTKIGNCVYFRMRLATNNLSGGSASDVVRISGLPFTASSSGSGGYPASILSQNFTANPPQGCQVVVGTSLIYLYRDKASTSALTALKVSDLSGGSGENDITITGHYYI